MYTPNVRFGGSCCLDNTTIGLFIGILSGYGGWIERILMRFTDIIMSMPSLILAFAFVAMLGPGLLNSALAFALQHGRHTRQAVVKFNTYAK